MKIVIGKQRIQCVYKSRLQVGLQVYGCVVVICGIVLIADFHFSLEDLQRVIHCTQRTKTSTIDHLTAADRFFFFQIFRVQQRVVGCKILMQEISIQAAAELFVSMRTKFYMLI